MKKLITLLTVLGMSFGSQSAFAFNVDSAVTPIEVTAAATDEYPESPSIYELTGGVLVALFADGSKIYSSISNDMGATWSAKYLIRDNPNQNGAVEFLQISETAVAYYGSTDEYKDGTLVVGELVNGELVWNEPYLFNFTDSVDNAAWMDFSSNGETITAVIYRMTAGENRNRVKISVAQSTDNGRNWSELPNPVTFEDRRYFGWLDSTTLADGTPVFIAEEQPIKEDTNVDQIRRLVGFRYLNNAWEEFAIPNYENYRDTSYYTTFPTILPINDGQGFMVEYGTFISDFNITTWPTATATPSPFINIPIGVSNKQVHEVANDGTLYVLASGSCTDGWSGCEDINLLKSENNGQSWGISNVTPSLRPDGDGKVLPHEFQVDDAGNISMIYQDYKTGDYGPSFWLTISTDGGATWSEPKLVLDGFNKYGWEFTSNLLNDGSAVFGWTQVNDLNTWFSIPMFVRVEGSARLPESLGFKAQFNFGELKLSAKRKAALKAWAEQIPAGTTVRVNAPNYEKPEIFKKAKRSQKRAKQIALVLRNAGLNVVVVKGKQVKWVDPVKGRAVKIRILKTES